MKNIFFCFLGLWAIFGIKKTSLFKLKYSWLTMLGYFLLYNKLTLLYIHTHTHTHIHSFLYLAFFFPIFWPCHMAYGILVPPSGIEYIPPASPGKPKMDGYLNTFLWCLLFGHLRIKMLSALNYVFWSTHNKGISSYHYDCPPVHFCCCVLP